MPTPVRLERLTSNTWKRLWAPLQAPPQAAPASVAHGDLLTRAHTSLAGLGLDSTALSYTSVPTRGYWRFDTPDEFAPTSTYTYNNTASNKGGVVPAGGLTIDGYTIPAGTRVVQFRDFSGGDFFASGGTSFLFRGCRFRGTNRAPGYFNCSSFTGKFYLGYCDLGGLGAADAQYNEVPVKISSAAGGIIYRNRISYTTTGLQINVGGFDVIENHISDLAYFYGPNPPPGESTDKHLNGITLNGSESCIRVLRNNITLPTPDGAGRQINQTDAISFFQDFGTFPGSGTNSDGTLGYRVLDNYVGGGGVCIYAGRNAGKAATTVSNMVMTGNKVTTQWWPNGGAVGPLTAQPTWGTQGNTWSGNTWADGPNAGQTISG